MASACPALGVFSAGLLIHRIQRFWNRTEERERDFSLQHRDLFGAIIS
jgi:hypothetical protein